MTNTMSQAKLVRAWIWTMMLWRRGGAESISTVEAPPPASVVPPHLLADFPSNITLKGGVLHAPPFAMVEKTPEGGYRYGGLQPDLLERLIVFAAADGVMLNFDLSVPAPPVWDDSLDLVAHDCEETLATYHPDTPQDDKYEGNDCNTFDIIVGEYTSTPERYQRADFTPPFLQSAIGALKYVGSPDEEDGEDSSPYQQQVATLTQADRMGATICGQAGGFTMRVVMARYPNAEYILCQSQTECFEHLEEGRCSLLTRDKLALKGKAFEDPRFEVTAEEFNTYYLVWPMRYDLPPVISYLMKRWVHRAVRNTTLDELYHKYFEKDLCPLGQAGPNCDLPCDANHGSADVHGRCICESVKWTGDDCSVEIEEDINSIPSSLKLLAYAMFAVNVAVILACAGWLVIHWSSEEVQASQPSFLLLVLWGCLISSSTIIAMAQEDEGNGPVPACAAIPWLYSVGFCVTFGTLFAKIRRVHRIFRQAANHRHLTATHRQQTNMTMSSSRHSSLSGSHTSLHSGVGDGRIQARRKSLQVSFQETMLVIGAVLLVDVAILIAWSVVDPLRWERTIVSETQFGEPLESQGYCICDSWPIFFGIIGALHLGLMATATYLCYKARAIPTKFQEGKYLSIAMVSNLQIFIVGGESLGTLDQYKGLHPSSEATSLPNNSFTHNFFASYPNEMYVIWEVPILIIVGSDPRSGFFVRATVIWMNDLAVVAIIFGNLMFRTKNLGYSRRSSLQRKMNQAVLKYSPGNANPTTGNVNQPVPRAQDDIQEQKQEIEQPSVQQETVNSSSSSRRTPENAAALPMPEPESLSQPSQPSQPLREFISSVSMSSEFGKGTAERQDAIPDKLSSLTMSPGKKSSNKTVSFALTDEEELTASLGVPLSTPEEGSGKRSNYNDAFARFTAADCHVEPPKPASRPSSTATADNVDEERMDPRTAKVSDLSPRRPIRAPSDEPSPQLPTRVFSPVDPPDLDALAAPFLDDDSNNNPTEDSFGRREQTLLVPTPEPVLGLEGGGSSHTGNGRWIPASRGHSRQTSQGAPERPTRLASELTPEESDTAHNSG